MKKWSLFNVIAYPTSAILVIIACSCTEGKDDQFFPQPNSRFWGDGITVTPTGGIIQALGGDVTLNFPADAVIQPTRFSVSVIMERADNETSDIGNFSNLAMHAILIEPNMVFNKPVQVSLKYGGCLCNGVCIKDGMNFSVMIWESEISFQKNEVPCACTSCLMSPDQGTVCMCICQSGVIAVQFD